MRQEIIHVTLVVNDYDEAIGFYVNVLDFKVVEDTYDPERDKRWVLIAPQNSGSASLLLAKASNNNQSSCIGNQTGGRVSFFLKTDNFWRDYHRYRKRGVRFLREPKNENYATVAVFEDLYGNRWDLLETPPQ